jgi:isopenicillin-N epimerase
VLHVAPRRRSGVRPLVASWRDELGFPRAFDLTGTTDVSAWLSAPAALRLLGRLGWDRIRDHNARLAAEGQSVLAGAVRSLGHDGTPLSRPGDDRLPMRLVALDPAVVAHAEDAARLQRCIAEVCAVEVAVTAAAGRGFLRLSAQVYNCPADYAVLAERIARVLPDQR